MLNQITTIEQLNELKPTIERVSDGFVFITNKGWFCLEIDFGYEPGDEGIVITENDMKDIFGPNEACDLGIITEQEREDWIEDNRINNELRVSRLREREFEEYQRLKKIFDTKESE